MFNYDVLRARYPRADVLPWYDQEMARLAAVLHEKSTKQRSIVSSFPTIPQGMCAVWSKLTHANWFVPEQCVEKMMALLDQATM